MGTNTDPYQRAEGKYRLTQGIIEVLGEAGNPFSILTKGTLVLRDLDRLVEAARHTRVELCFSIGTLDEDVWRDGARHAASPEADRGGRPAQRGGHPVRGAGRADPPGPVGRPRAARRGRTRASTPAHPRSRRCSSTSARA